MFGLNWQTLGLGSFAGNPNEADMLMRDSNTGNIEYFDIRGSQIVGAGPMGMHRDQLAGARHSAISAATPTKPT